MPLSQARYEGEQDGTDQDVVANANAGSHVGMEGETADLEFVLEDEDSPSSVESVK